MNLSQGLDMFFMCQEWVWRGGSVSTSEMARGNNLWIDEEKE